MSVVGAVKDVSYSLLEVELSGNIASSNLVTQVCNSLEVVDTMNKVSVWRICSVRGSQ